MKEKHPEIKIMVYSGDTDGSVPTKGTLGWIDSLGWTTTKAWAPYMYEGQVAGYTRTWG